LGHEFGNFFLEDSLELICIVSVESFEVVLHLLVHQLCVGFSHFSGSSFDIDDVEVVSSDVGWISKDELLTVGNCFDQPGLVIDQGLVVSDYFAVFGHDSGDHEEQEYIPQHIVDIL
jgi:hypothetical protein